MTPRTEVVIPLELFQGIAGYLIPRMSDDSAQMLYNGLVVAFAKQQDAATAETPADDV